MVLIHVQEFHEWHNSFQIEYPVVIFLLWHNSADWVGGNFPCFSLKDKDFVTSFISSYSKLSVISACMPQLYKRPSLDSSSLFVFLSKLEAYLPFSWFALPSYISSFSFPWSFLSNQQSFHQLIIYRRVSSYNTFGPIVLVSIAYGTDSRIKRSLSKTDICTHRHISCLFWTWRRICVWWR